MQKFILAFLLVFCAMAGRFAHADQGEDSIMQLFPPLKYGFDREVKKEDGECALTFEEGKKGMYCRSGAQILDLALPNCTSGSVIIKDRDGQYKCSSLNTIDFVLSKSLSILGEERIRKAIANGLEVSNISDIRAAELLATCNSYLDTDEDHPYGRVKELGEADSCMKLACAGVFREVPLFSVLAGSCQPPNTMDDRYSETACYYKRKLSTPQIGTPGSENYVPAATNVELGNQPLLVLRCLYSSKGLAL